MPSMSDEDLFFYNWMFNKTLAQSGYFRFVVYSYMNRRSYKTVHFTNAYCIRLKDFFNDQNSRLMLTTVTLSAEVITIGAESSSGSVFSNEWAQ